MFIDLFYTINVTIIPDEHVKFHAPTYTLHFNNCTEEEANYDNDDRTVSYFYIRFIIDYRFA